MPIGVRVTDLPAAAGTLDDDDEFLTLEDGSLRRATRTQAGPKAAIVQVADTANQFTATNVEGVLTEIQDNVDALVISGGGMAAASEAEALAGTDNTKAMTPLRAADVVAATRLHGPIHFFDDFRDTGPPTLSTSGHEWVTDDGGDGFDSTVTTVGTLSKPTAPGADYYWRVGGSPPGYTAVEMSFGTGTTDGATVALGTSVQTGTEALGATGIATYSVHMTCGPTAWSIGIFDGASLDYIATGNFSPALTADTRYWFVARKIGRNRVVIDLPDGTTTAAITDPRLATYWGRTTFWELYQPASTDRMPRIHRVATGGEPSTIPDVVRLPAPMLAPVAGLVPGEYDFAGGQPAWALHEGEIDAVAGVVEIPPGWRTFDIEVDVCQQTTGGGNVVLRGDYAWLDGASGDTAATVGGNVAAAMSTTMYAISTVTLNAAVAVNAAGYPIMVRTLRIGSDGGDTSTAHAFVTEMRLVQVT